MVWVLIFDDLFDELSSFEYCMCLYYPKTIQVHIVICQIHYLYWTSICTSILLNILKFKFYVTTTLEWSGKKGVNKYLSSFLAPNICRKFEFRSRFDDTSNVYRHCLFPHQSHLYPKGTPPKPLNIRLTSTSLNIYINIQLVLDYNHSVSVLIN